MALNNYIPLPNKKYNIIYADPPWSYYNDSDAMINCTTVKGIRRPPYNVLGTDSIKKIPIYDISDDKCFLFIWTTDYHLEKCIEVIKAWGFKYKTIGFAWSKRNKNGKPIKFCGAYTLKSGIELCLLATKGNNLKKLIKKFNVESYIESERQEHSKKPDEIRDRIIDLVGDLPRIELFARQKTNGWDVWGNEV